MQTATAETVKAYWAYSELTSPRWKPTAQAAIPDLLNEASRGVPFHQIPAATYPALIAWLKTVPGRDAPGFVDNLDRSPEYAVADLSRIQLMKLWALPCFDPSGQNQPVIFPRFLISGPNLAADGKPDKFDPRSDFDWARPQPPFQQTFAGIVVNGGAPVLIEGYGRSLQFFRDSSATDQFKTWWPVGLALP